MLTPHTPLVLQALLRHGKWQQCETNARQQARPRYSVTHASKAGAGVSTHVQGRVELRLLEQLFLDLRQRPDNDIVMTVRRTTSTAPSTLAHLLNC